MLGNRFDKSSLCFMFPRQIAQIITKYAFEDLKSWIPRDENGHTDMKTITLEYENSCKLKSFEDCLSVPFYHSAKQNPMQSLEAYEESETGVSELYVKFCIPEIEEKNIDLPNYIYPRDIYRIISFCYHSDTLKLNIDGVNFQNLVHYGSFNPGQTFENMPAIHNIFCNNVDGADYPLPKLEIINITNCFEVHWFLKRFTLSINSKQSFDYPSLKVNDFIHRQAIDMCEQNSKWVPVQDSVQITINYNKKTIDIVRK